MRGKYLYVTVLKEFTQGVPPGTIRNITIYETILIRVLAFYPISPTIFLKAPKAGSG